MPGAASLLILRNPDSPEVYWVQRRLTDRFLSGFHAFPGGKIDPEDLAAVEGDPVQAARVAAIRETLEETGPNALSFLEQGWPYKSDLHRLTPAGCWSSPPYLGLVFDTHYFAVWDEVAQPVVHLANPELEAGAWIRPAEALAAWRRSEVLLAPPTQALLLALASWSGAHQPAFLKADGASGECLRYSQIRPDITLFPMRTPTLPPATHTNTYLIGGSEFLLVEPASPYTEERRALQAHLDARMAEGHHLRGIFLTHHHHDHIGAVAHFASLYQVPVMAHHETANRVPFTVDELYDQGDKIQLSDGVILDVHHTPGHAPGHLCLVHRGCGTAVVGDMVAGLGSILVEPVDGDMAAYLDSLARLRKLGLSCLLPSHGPGIGGADEKLTEYITHRLNRERLTIDALNAGKSSLTALLEVVYADVPSMLRTGPGGGLAGASLKAHLIKLCDEGRAIQLGEESWSVGPLPT